MRLIALAAIAALVGRTAGAVTPAITQNDCALTANYHCPAITGGRAAKCVDSCSVLTCKGFEAGVPQTTGASKTCANPNPANCALTSSTKKFCPLGASAEADQCVNSCAVCTGYTTEDATCGADAVATRHRTQKTTKKTGTNTDSEDDEGLSDEMIAGLVAAGVLIAGAVAIVAFPPLGNLFCPDKSTYAFVGADGEGVGRPTGNQVAAWEASQADIGLQF